VQTEHEILICKQRLEEILVSLKTGTPLSQANRSFIRQQSMVSRGGAHPIGG